MDVNLLKSKMALKGDTLNELANALNITRNALYCKMSQIYEFKQGEISIIADRYELTNDEIRKIFFS